MVKPCSHQYMELGKQCVSYWSMAVTASFLKVLTVKLLVKQTKLQFSYCFLSTSFETNKVVIFH